MSTVTIGIPTFNRPHQLRAALESASQQKYPYLTILVSDNASPGDETRTVVEEFQKVDSRIVYHRHQQNLGANKNFLWLAEYSSGIYFMWLADDDELKDSDHVSALIDGFKAEPSARLVFPDVDIHLDQDKRTWARHVNDDNFGNCRSDEDYLQAWCKFGGGYPIYGLYRLEHLRELLRLNSFDDTLVYYNEGMFLHQAFLRGGLRYSNKATLIYNGLNSSARISSRRLLASFLRYSFQTHSHYIAARRWDLLPLIARSHYPYIRVLARKAARNDVGG